MNIEEYISTGVLESYVLGEASPAQRAEIERLLMEHEGIREELKRIELTLEAFAVKTSVQPRAELKSKILSRASQKDGKEVAMQAPAWKWAAAASIVIALTSSILAYNYYEKWQQTSLAMDNLIAKNQVMAQNYNVVNQRLDKIQSDLSIIENTSFTKVVMKGTDNAPDALASVYWNPNTEEVYLSIQNLKVLSEANQFQLWAIVDGKPVDAGVFDAGIDGLLKMKPITGAVAFAVTVEPRGGKKSPTLETMQVIGTMPT